MVDKDSVPSVGNIKRNIFVGLFTACTAVAVPDIDTLAVFDKGSEAFTQSVYALAHSQLQLFADKGACSLHFQISSAARFAGCDQIGTAEKLEGKLAALVDHCLEPAAAQPGLLTRVDDLKVISGCIHGIAAQLKTGPPGLGSCMMINPDTDYLRHW